MTLRRVGAVSLALLLGACAGRVVPPSAETAAPVRAARPARPAVHPSAVTAEPSVRTLTPGRIVAATPLLPAPVAPPSGAATAAAAGVVPGPAVAGLALDARQAAGALIAFRRSCPGLMRRNDPTGLTRGTDWQPACAAAATGADDPAGFFARWFETAQVGDGKAFATGYYEPEIAGSLEERPGSVPIYARPADLVDVDLGPFADDLKGRSIRGKVQNGKLVLYDDRTQIEERSLATRAPVLAWAADPIEFFFLQIQGSGRVRLPDGRILRIGYDTQNGRGYTGIGKLMRDRGLLGPGQTSMQGIVAWLRANPEGGRAIMRENKSFVFFRELSGAPIGAMGYAVDGQVSAAVDVKFVPLGAPVYLSMDRADATGLWVAQDTGGAIKGSNRFDTFWGAGQAAATVAGGMAARGTAFLLLPVGTVARLQAAQGGGGGTGAGASPAQP